MNLKSLAPLMLSLFASSVFAHSYHDDEAPQPPLKQEAAKEAKPATPKPKKQQKHWHDAAVEKQKPAAESPASAIPAEPKKAP